VSAEVFKSGKERETEMSGKGSVITREEQSAQLLRNLEQAVQLSTGKSSDELRKTTICDLRRQTQKQKGFITRFKSFAQWIGRGNVLGDRTKTEREINDMIDAVSR
jgi:hypothetical protein